MSSRNVPILTIQYRPYWCMCRTLHVFPKGRSLAPRFRFKKACFLSSQQEGLPLSAHYWTHLFLSCSWVFFRGIFIETKGALFWFGLLCLLPIGLELKCVTQQVWWAIQSLLFYLSFTFFVLAIVPKCFMGLNVTGSEETYWINWNVYVEIESVELILSLSFPSG